MRFEKSIQHKAVACILFIYFYEKWVFSIYSLKFSSATKIVLQVCSSVILSLLASKDVYVLRGVYVYTISNISNLNYDMILLIVLLFSSSNLSPLKF